MKVILTDYVYKHGVKGDVVTVSDGFARNYLIPRGMAVKATPGALRNNQHLIAQASKNRADLKFRENEAAAKIHGVELVFGVKAGKNNKLYGSVTTMDIARALLEKTGQDINRRRISERPLRELGVHEVPVRLGADATPILRVVLLREEEVAPYLSGQAVPTLLNLGHQTETVEVEEETPDEAAGDEIIEEVADEPVSDETAVE